MTSRTRPECVEKITTRPFPVLHWSWTNQNGCALRSSNSKLKSACSVLILIERPKWRTQTKIFAHFLQFQASLCLRIGRFPLNYSLCEWIRHRYIELCRRMFDVCILNGAVMWLGIWLISSSGDWKTKSKYNTVNLAWTLQVDPGVHSVFSLLACVGLFCLQTTVWWMAGCWRCLREWY